MSSPSASPLFAGFDLGTTNSAAAVFDGDKVTIIRNAQGGALTPSVVRLDKEGRVTVGERARRFEARDPGSVRSEFKRLMGTGRAVTFPSSGQTRLPEQLAAEILRSLRADVKAQLGVLPMQAVVSVPALFELPQSAATSEAARLAGLERVELIQEPIASALAAGWSASEGGGRWLVYDLGGGTFDASVLDEREGLLRVIAHGGDNFLGGRDLDAAIVDHLVELLASRHGVELHRDDPHHGPVLDALKAIAEEAKIELSRAPEALLAPAMPIELDGRELSFEEPLSRATLEALATPLVDRTIEVCRRLMEETKTREGELTRIVLVGGPTVTPWLRHRVAEALGAPIAEGHDPMTLVATGAALFAATTGLSATPARPESGGSGTSAPGRRVLLNFPPMSADLTPHIVGRVVEPRAQPAIEAVRVRRADGLFESDWVLLDHEGAFVLPTELLPRRPNVFQLEARDAEGVRIATEPSTVTIVQGVTIGDPPLSRTIGVALADDSVQVYFDRGTPLPARRTFTHHTVEAAVRGAEQNVLRIPIVQGELGRAHLCRLVGAIDISGRALSDHLPSGSKVEMTLELDRGGRLTARAYVPVLDQVFDQVARLLVPDADPETLAASFESLRARVAELRTEAFRRRWAAVLGKLVTVETSFAELERSIAAARGGDADAAQKARRSLLELDASVDAAELEKQWPELEDEARHAVLWATGWVQEHGTEGERRMLGELSASVDKARDAKDAPELQRHVKQVRQLGYQCFQRDPEVWQTELEQASSNVDRATDIVRARALVAEGRELVRNADHRGLRRVVEKLWGLMPPDVQARRRSYDSSVR